jgi:hypothetical protein
MTGQQPVSLRLAEALLYRFGVDPALIGDLVLYGHLHFPRKEMLSNYDMSKVAELARRLLAGPISCPTVQAR